MGSIYSPPPINFRKQWCKRSVFSDRPGGYTRFFRGANIQFKISSRQDAKNAKEFLECRGFSPDRRIAAPTTALAISLLSLRSLRLCESSFLTVSRAVCWVEASAKPGRRVAHRHRGFPPIAGTYPSNHVANRKNCVPFPRLGVYFHNPGLYRPFSPDLSET